MLSRRESGGRLLAAGVIGVIGAFASGQAVRIVIRSRVEGTDPESSSTPSTSMVQSDSGIPPWPANDSDEPQSALEPKSSSAEDLVAVERGQPGVIEVGRGLASYNSEQIQKVKGLNRYVSDM